jgi:flavin-binding protein dodecin
VTNHVYKQIELTGSSASSIEEAVQVALAKAAETVRNMRWFEVTDIRGHIADQKLGHWQVTVKVGFTLDD